MRLRVIILRAAQTQVGDLWGQGHAAVQGRDGQGRLLGWLRIQRLIPLGGWIPLGLVDALLTSAQAQQASAQL